MITPTMNRPARIDLGALLNTRPDRYEEARNWVASLDVNISDVTQQIAIVAGDHSYLLHLTSYLRDEQGRMRLDVAADRPVTEPVVIDLGTSPTWPTWLVSE